MPFFPLSNILDTKGFCTVHNYTPNNWQNTEANIKTLWAIYSDGNHWMTKKLESIEVGDSKTIHYEDFGLPTMANISPLIALQFRRTNLPERLDSLPSQEFAFTTAPEWRSTVGFSLGTTQTSYQGEINPFPPKASLLTFHPFIQYNEINNYFAFINIEQNPIYRTALLEIYNARTLKLIDTVEVRNNSTNVIPLDIYNFTAQDLPVFVCRSMAGIPFGFGINAEAPMLSLEHTHPPASFAVHGQRFMVQKKIKEHWFSILKLK